MRDNYFTDKVRDHFDGRRRLRTWSNTHFGGMDAAKAHPVGMCGFLPNEGGTVHTKLNLQLAPVSGYMRSTAYAHVVQIFVPYQAIEKQINDWQEDAGVTEMTRRRLMAGEGFGLTDEGEISRAAKVNPRSIGGQKRVSRMIPAAYQASVNHLRRSAYHAAETIKWAEDGSWNIQPAVLTANVLERFNGVLDPERHVDGAINLTGELPLRGIGRGVPSPRMVDNVASVEPQKSNDGNNGPEDAQSVQYPHGTDLGANGGDIAMRLSEDGVPQLFVDLAGTSEITLRDMVVSKKLDALVRRFAKLIDDDPINGPERVERALYGLSVDYDANCQVLYDEVYPLKARHYRPTDGASVNEVSAHFQLEDDFATIVPRSELGGILVTLVMVKPMEVLSQQPDPILTEPWGLVNVVHDETELDEVLLTRSDLESDLQANEEDTPVFWVGHNALKHDYVTQGPNEAQMYAQETKASMWLYKVPTSVTPANISYPENIDMYPFHHWNGAHAEYTISQQALISTTLAKGPNPVERLQVFADDPQLLDPDA